MPRVDIVYAHANMDAAQIEDAVKGGRSGIVLAGVGDGNGSQAAIEALTEGRQTGCGRSASASRAMGSGYVNRNVEVDDDKLGLVASLDLNPQKARISGLNPLIANGTTDAEQVQDAFTASLVSSVPSARPTAPASDSAASGCSRTWAFVLKLPRFGGSVWGFG